MGLRDYNHKHTLKKGRVRIFLCLPVPQSSALLQLVLEMPCCESVTYSIVERRDLLRPQFWRIPFAAHGSLYPRGGGADANIRANSREEKTNDSRALRKPPIATPWNSNRRSAGHFVGEDAKRLGNPYQDANSLHGSDRAKAYTLCENGRRAVGVRASQIAVTNRTCRSSYPANVVCTEPGTVLPG